MALTVQIQPVQILTKTATKLSAYVINYDLESQICVIYWWLSDENNNRLYESNYNVPPDIIQNWGHDDSIIIQSLANDNGFTIIP